MKNNFQITVISSIAFLFASCGNSGKRPSPKVQKAADVFQLMTLEPHNISSTVQLPGVLEPYQFVQIYPKISGFVKDVMVDRGSVVHRGSILIKMEAPEIEQHVAAAKLKYAQASAMYQNSKDRYRRLLETNKTPGTISAYDLAAAQSKMQADEASAQAEEADYKAQQDMNQYLTIAAPFDGVITERNIHPGALAGPGTQGAKPMLVLQQQSRLRLVVNIPEQFSAQVKNSDTVHFRINALPGRDFTGKVSRASGALNSNFRSETIEIDVLNPQNTYKAGMYAEVVIPVSGNANAYTVPRSAIVTTTERKYVILKESGKAKFVDVTEGNQAADSSEVFGSLHQNDQVIVKAGYQISEGTAIN